MIPTQIGPFTFKEKLGEGGFAVTYRAEHNVTRTSVAIKCISIEQVKSANLENRLIREISILKQLKHPLIATLFNTYQDENYYYLVMEYVENGNLRDYINSNGRLMEAVAKRYFMQLISVLDYLHNSKQIAHRDIKPENILLDRYYNIRIIDFGLSNYFSDASPQFNTHCGTPQYIAPEVAKGESYTKSADIWSAGIVLYTMVCGELPFDDSDTEKMLNAIISQQPYIKLPLSNPFKDLIFKLLAKDPSERITIEHIKESTWFSPTEYSAIDEYAKNQIKATSSCETSASMLERMKTLGFDTAELKREMLEGNITDLTMAYAMLQKDRALLDIRSAMRPRQGIRTSTPQPLALLAGNTRARSLPCQQQSPLVPLVNAKGIQAPLRRPETLVSAKFVPPRVMSRRTDRMRCASVVAN